MARRWTGGFGSLALTGLLLGLVAGCASPSRSSLLSSACRSVLEQRHRGLADQLVLVTGRAAGTTIWIARSRAVTVVVECASLASPQPQSYELRVDGVRHVPGGQELVARGGDVLQASWFDAVRGRAPRIAVVRNGGSYGRPARTVPLAPHGRCPDVRGAVRLVSCTWIDVVEWRVPRSPELAGPSPVDVVVKRGTDATGGASEPFWLFRRASRNGEVVLRFGVGRLERGSYQLEARPDGPRGRFTVR